MRNSKEEIKSYFDEISAEYTAVYDTPAYDSLRSYIFSSRKKYVCKFLAPTMGRILDIGCGPGVFTEELLDKAGEVYGIDISEAMVETAKRRIEGQGIENRVHFSKGDIEALDLQDGFFDAVICIGVLEYLRDDNLALKELFRVLKKGGELVVSVPNITSPFTLIDIAFARIARKIMRSYCAPSTYNIRMKKSLFFRDNIIDRYYTPWNFTRQLRQHGFKVMDCLFHTCRFASLGIISPQLALGFSRNLEWLTKTPLSWTGVNFIVRAKKE